MSRKHKTHLQMQYEFIEKIIKNYSFIIRKMDDKIIFDCAFAFDCLECERMMECEMMFEENLPNLTIQNAEPLIKKYPEMFI